MKDFNNVTRFAEYLSFHVSSETNKDGVVIGSYDGDAGEGIFQIILAKNY